MSALVRITTGIMPQHSRVGMTRAMTQFGEVIHCHKPPYSGIPGEDFVNVRFGTQDAADRAYAALKGAQVFVDGFQVGVGPAATPKPDGNNFLGNGGNGDAMRRRSPSPPRRYGRGLNQQGRNQNRGRSPPRQTSRDFAMERGGGGRRRSPSQSKGNFPSRNDPKSPSPRRLARDMHMSNRGGSRSRSRGRNRGDAGFGGGGGMIRAKTPPRSPSPDPPGPVKNTNPVKNPFYKATRSPSRSASRGRGYNKGYDLE